MTLVQVVTYNAFGRSDAPEEMSELLSPDAEVVAVCIQELTTSYDALLSVPPELPRLVSSLTLIPEQFIRNVMKLFQIYMAMLTWVLVTLVAEAAMTILLQVNPFKVPVTQR